MIDFTSDAFAKSQYKWNGLPSANIYMLNQSLPNRYRSASPTAPSPIKFNKDLKTPGSKKYFSVSPGRFASPGRAAKK